MKLLSKSFIPQSTGFHFAKYRFPFRKVKISISQSTDFYFTRYRFPFHKVPISISQSTDFISFRFANSEKYHFTKYNKPLLILLWISMVQSNLTYTSFEVAANKNHTIFSGRAQVMGKVEKTRQFLTPKNTKGMRSQILDASWLRHTS